MPTTQELADRATELVGRALADLVSFADGVSQRDADEAFILVSDRLSADERPDRADDVSTWVAHCSAQLLKALSVQRSQVS